MGKLVHVERRLKQRQKNDLIKRCDREAQSGKYKEHDGCLPEGSLEVKCNEQFVKKRSITIKILSKSTCSHSNRHSQDMHSTQYILYIPQWAAVISTGKHKAIRYFDVLPLALGPTSSVQSPLSRRKTRPS